MKVELFPTFEEGSDNGQAAGGKTITSHKILSEFQCIATRRTPEPGTHMISRHGAGWMFFKIRSVNSRFKKKAKHLHRPLFIPSSSFSLLIPDI